MNHKQITERDRKMARGCMECPVCNGARKKQRGVAFWFVKNIEGWLCPYCKAYEKVYGRKAHKPTPVKHSTVLNCCDNMADSIHQPLSE